MRSARGTHAIRSLATLLATLVVGGCAPGPEDGGADLVLTGGRVWTGVEEAPWAEAVAIRDGRIAAVGTASDVGTHQGPGTRVVELEGRMVTPGFIDNHTHFNRAGELLLGVNLLAVSDEEALVREVAATVERLPDGAWMVGGSWGAYEEWGLGSAGEDEEGGEEGPDEPFRPLRTVIDSVSPNNPALLWNWDRSLFLANGAALTAAGADCSWSGVECEGGEPTGRLSGGAADRIREAIPPKTMEQRLAEARVALDSLRAHGVTTFFDITPPYQVAVYDSLRKAGELTARVHMRMVIDTWDELTRDAGITDGFGDLWVKYQGLKGFVDGIMGNSSARFYEPYLTTGLVGEWRDATNTGHATDGGSGMEPPGNMLGNVAGSDSVGWNPRVHAIGTVAIDSILDIYRWVLDRNPPRDDRRFAIIHNQVLSGPEAARRQAEMGIVAEMQPYHTIDDMRWMEERIGERSRYAYAFKTLLDAGVLLSFGSDWPGTNAAWYTSDPLQGIYAAVTRQTLEGTPEGGWFPEERISVEEALKAYTVNNAWVGGEEDLKGKVAEGFLADLAVLDRDIFEIDPAELKEVLVEMTILGGDVVFQR